MKQSRETSYYDFTGMLGVPYFHWGGLRATEELLRLCRAGRDSRVLAVGCGTGYSACHVAKRFGCRVVGFDIAQEMVRKANARSSEWGLERRARFLVADARSMPFADGTFDIVMSEFVTVLLGDEGTLREYARVIQEGGFVGVNELYTSATAPPAARERIETAQKGFEEAIGLPLGLPTPAEWEGWFIGAGLKDVRLKRIRARYRAREFVEAAGGGLIALRLILRVLYHLLLDKRFRKWARGAGKLKRTLMDDRKTRRHVGALLCTGRK